MFPILVTGVPRSGSSLVAQVIKACGAFSGNTDKMFENIDILKLEKEFYSDLGGDPNAQYPLLDGSIPIPSNWRSRVLELLFDQGYDGTSKFLYKSHLVTLIWRVWSFAFPRAKWVIVRRKPTEIVQSCKLTGYMTAFKNPENLRKIGASTEDDGWKWMIREYEKRFVQIIEKGLDVKVVWPHRIIYGDYSQMIELVNWLGLEWKSDILPMIDFKFLKVRRRNGVS